MKPQENTKTAPESEPSSTEALPPNPASASQEHDSSSATGGDASAASGGTDGEAGSGKKRKRRRRRKSGGSNASPSPGTAKSRPHPEPSAESSSESSPEPTGAKAQALSALTAGLFSHVDDRQVPCKVDGCHETWTWSAAEQIQNWGQSPPKRMCPKHMATMSELTDAQVPCANPGCDKTWTWPKSAQLAHMRGQSQKTGNATPPRKVCDDCRKAERELADAEVQCRVDGCSRTWTWSRDAQLKHRTWMRRQAGEDGGGSDDKRKRRRKRKRKLSVDEPPRRMCEVCKTKLGKLVEREAGCKVHGCTRTVTIDRESQLRAWVALRTEDLEAEGALPKRMCEVCREFCRLHPDREVACGRPGCDHTWTYKTGAQLQAFLAGRLEDPIRLCEECAAGDFARQAALDESLPPGTERMPCIVAGCDGAWLMGPDTRVDAADDGDQPVDRMCEAHRVAHGAEPRSSPSEGAQARPDEGHESADAPQP